MAFPFVQDVASFVMIPASFTIVNAGRGKGLILRGLLRHSKAVRNDPAFWMRVLATLTLMIALLAMGVATASADIARPSCSSQIRAQDMCYAMGLPDSKGETAKKSGICLVCLVPGSGADDPVRPVLRLHAALGATIPTGNRWTAPWRPPRAGSL